ncbi:hypothetical protein, partial [Lujinxingia vulgaris]|uniref:hypothetical protein n=1 Tax=Lujinxingia vulgaris TaxID=2600176 RepID=UPI001E2B52A2
PWMRSDFLFCEERFVGPGCARIFYFAKNVSSALDALGFFILRRTFRRPWMRSDFLFCEERFVGPGCARIFYFAKNVSSALDALGLFGSRAPPTALTNRPTSRTPALHNHPTTQPPNHPTTQPPNHS